jgi:hypothetical protein
MDGDDDKEKFYNELQLSIAHSQITQRFPPMSEEEKEKVLQSLFVDRSDYEQYVVLLQQREEQERKDDESREAARLARLENDPAYWKRLYLDMVEREKERKKQKEITQSIWIVSGVVGALLLLLKFIGWL